ncbi:hypothetical protein Q9R46_07265 [Paenibacillus sp. RRE4]|uniref:DUF6557 family protein n=1 Tax=Paenibacillus sp. RRE4 TaxID=2962587 RepID=UPI002881DBFC|nr:DUF6557 family protein [Paenibacillus sp. RRE4]MDT0122433.1 hypothetical protein [Paenibacillus sp. RRE4]
MITFKEILERVTFDAVWDNLIKYYPDMSQIKEKYLILYESILLQNPATNVVEMIVHIDSIDSDGDKDKKDIEYRVHGKNNSPEWEGYWDLSASKWGEWLGFYVDQQVLEQFSNEQIVALCLVEMTWFGFSEEQIKDRIDHLEDD